MSKRPIRSLVAGAVLTLTTLSAIASPAPIAGPVTVGDFAVKISRALGYPVEDRDAAANNLRLAGVHIEAEIDATLTEGRAAEIMKELGVPAQASGDPGVPMTTGKADMAAANVALTMAAQPDGVSTESIPTSCGGVHDRMSCYACCTGLLLPIARYPFRVVLLCGLVCATLFPPSSAWSPATRN